MVCFSCMNGWILWKINIKNIYSIYNNNNSNFFCKANKNYEIKNGGVRIVYLQK